MDFLLWRRSWSKPKSTVLKQIVQALIYPVKYEPGELDPPLCVHVLKQSIFLQENRLSGFLFFYPTPNDEFYDNIVLT